MLFRSRRPETPVGARFGLRPDVFVFRREGELDVAQVAAAPEESAEHFHALLAQMPAVVDFEMSCARTGRRFVGEGLSRAEVTEAVGRMKVPLVASGGVELAAYTADEQLSLTPMLDLWIYARSDRWLYLLLGRGLEEVSELPGRTWNVARSEFAGGAPLVDAVTRAAERLTLRLG